MLQTSEHRSRLTLVAAFLFDWLISAGAKIIRIGLRQLVDRKDRRDLSLFQIGWRFIDRQLLRLLSFPLSVCAYLTQVATCQRKLMLQARTKRATLISNPLAVIA